LLTVSRFRSSAATARRPSALAVRSSVEIARRQAVVGQERCHISSTANDKNRDFVAQ
jgi:hypothetical protein